MKKLALPILAVLLSFFATGQDYDQRAMEESSDAIEEILPDVKWHVTTAEILAKGKYSGDAVTGMESLKKQNLYRIYQFNGDGTMTAEFETWGKFTGWMLADGAEIEITGDTINDGAYAYFWEYTVDKLVMVLTQYGKDERLKFTLEPMN